MNPDEIVCVLDVPQKSDAWLQARCGKMGGTSANSIGEHSPYSKAKDVFCDLIRSCPKCMKHACEHYDELELKNKEQMSKNPHVKRGNDMEPVIRAQSEQKFNIPHIEDGRMTWLASYPFIRDSCDGIAFWQVDGLWEKVVFEFKAPQNQTPDVPPSYMPQIHMHMFTNRVQKCIFGSYHHTGSRWWLVKRNEEYLQWLLRRMQLVFWCAANENPALSKDVDPTLFGEYKGWAASWAEHCGSPFPLEELRKCITPLS